MSRHITNALLSAIVVLLGMNLAANVGLIAPARAAAAVEVEDVIRARLIELVTKDGRVVGQLHTAEDGSGNLRLRSGDGEVRVKLGATRDGAGLVLLDGNTAPAVSLAVHAQGTSVTLSRDH